jgi:hypothetical protein
MPKKSLEETVRQLARFNNLLLDYIRKSDGYTQPGAKKKSLEELLKELRDELKRGDFAGENPF